MITGAVNVFVSPLRGMTSGTVSLGQDPAAFVVGRYTVGSALGTLRNNGQAAQAVALQIASIVQDTARQIR